MRTPARARRGCRRPGVCTCLILLVYSYSTWDVCRLVKSDIFPRRGQICLNLSVPPYRRSAACLVSVGSHSGGLSWVLEPGWGPPCFALLVGTRIPAPYPVLRAAITNMPPKIKKGTKTCTQTSAMDGVCLHGILGISCLVKGWVCCSLYRISVVSYSYGGSRNGMRKT